MALPSLPALDIFLAVARHGSFRRAANERGVSPSALSHAIRGLEEALGVRLFNRTNRSVRITAAGEHLLRRIGPALGDIAEAVEQVGLYRDRAAGTLRLNVPRNAAELVSVPVGPPLRFAVVGSPAYFASRDAPRVPQDLAGHACIGRRYPSGAHYAWVFAQGNEKFKIDVSGPLIADDRALIVAAALDGIGLAHIHEALVADHLAQGDLVRVLGDWCPALPTFFLYYAGRRQLPAPLRAFIDMVRN